MNLRITFDMKSKHGHTMGFSDIAKISVNILFLYLVGLHTYTQKIFEIFEIKCENIRSQSQF